MQQKYDVVRAVRWLGLALAIPALVMAGCKEQGQAPAAEAGEPAVQVADPVEPANAMDGRETALDFEPPSEPAPHVLPMPEGELATIPFDDPSASPAVIQRRFYCFHLDPVVEDVPKLVATISRRGWLDANFTAAQVSGFVTASLERYPDQVQAWLEAAERDIPLTQRGVVWHGIWNADVEGTEEALRAYAEAVDDGTARTFIRSMVRHEPWLLLEGGVQNQIDAHRLVGALVGSGSDAHLQRVIDTIMLNAPSQVPLNSTGELNAGANAKAALAAVTAMNDDLFNRVRERQQAAEAGSELSWLLETVLESAEVQRSGGPPTLN